MDNRILTSERITFLMKEKDISYRELSEKTGISKSTIQRYVTNTKSKFPADNLFKIAKALNVNVVYLMGLSDNAKIGETNPKNVPLGINPELESFFMEKLKENETATKKLIDLATDLTEDDLEPVFILLQGIRKSKGLN